MFLFRTRSGNQGALLNPAEKGIKYSAELKQNKQFTNLGECKVDARGNCKKLTRAQKAYRSGYLDARRDSANAFLANKGLRPRRRTRRSRRSSSRSIVVR